MRELHESVNKKWRITDANLWLSQRFRNCPLIADDILRACSNTTLNPYVLFVVGATTSQYYAKQCDYFACGLEGTLEDQIVNATIELQGFTTIEELELSELQLTQFDGLWAALERFLDGMVRDTPDPLPQPEPPKPKPAPKPEPEPQFPPSEPAKPPINWKATLAVWVGIVSAAMVVLKIFLPGPVAAIIDAILKVLNAIVGS